MEYAKAKQIKTDGGTTVEAELATKASTAALTGKQDILPADSLGLINKTAGSSKFLREDGTWQTVSGGGSGDVEEAPTDGKQYARKDGAWEEITDGTKIQWGTISGDVTLTDADNGKTFLITNDAVITINDGLSAGWNVAFIPDDSKDETAHVASLAFVGSGSAIGGAATIKGVSSLALTPTANLFATAGAIE